MMRQARWLLSRDALRVPAAVRGQRQRARSGDAPFAIVVPRVDPYVKRADVVGTMSEVLCAVGSRFFMDEEIAVIETDKVALSVHAPRDGVVAAVLVAEGDDVAGHTTSALQREVGRGLERLGYRYTNEFVTPEGYSLDMAITEHGPQWIAVEADGPHHFASDGSPNGATLLKRRQLANLGWKLVPVRYDEWYALERDLMREDAFLRAAIANATGQPVSNIGINMQQQPHWQAPIMQPAAASAIAANYMAAKQNASVRPFGGAW